MAKLQPFRAYRPVLGLESKIASPPYDVINSKEARIMAAGNQHSFLHVVKPEIDLDESIDTHDERVYAKARENFQNFITEGFLIREEIPSLYLYRLVMGEHWQIGLVAGVSVLEYETDKIKKHELTRKDKEDDRTRHVDVVNANAGPVFLTYRSQPEIDAKIACLCQNIPIYDFTANDGIKHTIWVISHPYDLDEIRHLFTQVPDLYVADGHHRSASAARVGAARRAIDPSPSGEKVYDYFLAVLFPHDQLAILDYNRVVKDLNGLSREAFLKAVSRNFIVAPASQPKPEQPNMFGMYLPGQWYRLQTKPGTFPSNDPVKSLDVSILQDNLLAPVLGIHDPRTDTRIDFVGGIRGTNELEQRVNDGEAVAFAMFPTSIDQLMSIADAGKVMPPKSTWFEPKLRSGLIVRSLEDI
ncbi:DUF1015 domain-containing protein [bacterium]|nr:DUF1015 domain-containing protein [candidate division CSSED10-310 bacterium]